MNNMQKCAVVGCGFVGSATAFELASQGVFSEIVLLDINKEKAKGEALDIAHGMPFGHPINIYAGDYPDVADCGLVIIAAGANQKEGETRLDLVDKNVKIFRSIIPQITKYNRECIFLILSNPVDILTYVTLKPSGFSWRKVIGSGTVLDTARFKYLLGQHLQVDMRNVHAFIIGEHGDSELAVWSSANVSGIDLNEYCKICGSCNNMESMYRLYDEVRDSAYNIIKAKGATYYAIAMSATRIAKAIVRNERSVLTTSALMDDHYGMKDVCIGFPCVIGGEGIQKVLDIPLSDKEQAYLKKSADALREILAQIDI